MDAAVEAGADDYRDEGELWVVVTPIGDLDRVTAGLESKKLPVQSSKLAYVPKNKKPIGGRDAEVCLGLIEGLDEHEDVQNVYTDLDVSDEELQRIAGEG